MSKRWMNLLGLLAICGLVACRSADAPTLEPEATATQSRETAPQPTATATQAAATASEPGAEQMPPWQIPELRESDWAKGAEDAGLVLVEYSDYQ